MKRRIPQRRRIFTGCEGESERGYVRLLSRLIDERHRLVHLDAVLLGGGDPLAIVETAGRRLQSSASRGNPYVARVVFLDADKRNLVPARTTRAIELAAHLRIQMIWQEPCHEGLLLRHLPNCEQLRPPTTQRAMMELQNRWPEYEKAMPAVRLATRIDREAVLRAANVHEALRSFLEEIEFDSDAG